MKKRFLLSAGLLLVSLIAPVTVFAHEEAAADNSNDASEVREAAKEHAANARKKKEDKVAEVKLKVSERKLSLKKDACDAREDKLKKLQPKIKNNTNTIKGVIDRKYDRVVAFYESGKLTTADYDKLVEAIELAKANAETSIETLSVYEFDVDCESTAAAADLDAYREAVSEVKQGLKDYRKSLVDLINSLKSASAHEDSTDGSNTSATPNVGTEGGSENE